MSETTQIIRHAFSLPRLWNGALIYGSLGLSELLGRPLVAGLPSVLMVEPTNACNLKCPLCPTGAGTLGRPKAFLDYDLYTRVIDELSRSLFMLLLWNQGESFLHKRFWDMVRYAVSKRIWTYASTNGHFLANSEEIVESGLGTLLVSVDGASAETYSAYRRSGDFDLVIRGLKELVETKRRLGKHTPVIHLQFIVMRHNEHEIALIDKLARECGVDRLTLKTVQIYDDEDIDVWLPENEGRSRYKLVQDESGAQHFALKHGYRNRCKRLWTQPVLNAGGELCVCCFDKDSSFAIGQLQEHSFRELWKSQRYREFRQAIFRDRGQFEMCRNCGEGVKLNLEQRDVDVRLDRPLEDSLRKSGMSLPNAEAAVLKIQRAKHSRTESCDGRDGVAGMSLGHGPRKQDELGHGQKGKKS